MDSATSKETFNWFNEDDDDFKTICFLAYLAPAEVIEKQRHVCVLIQQGATLSDL
jgi:hypothetical protein